MIQTSSCLIFEKEIFIKEDLVYITYDAKTNQKSSHVIKGKINFISDVSICIDCSKQFESKTITLYVKDIERVTRCK